MILQRIAMRNVFRQKRRSLLLVAAIAFGAFAITILNGFTTGVEANAKENLSNLYGGHLYIRGIETLSTGTRIPVIRNEKPLLAALEASGIKTASVVKRTSIRGSLIMGAREAPSNIVGVDWNAETLLKDRMPLSSGSFDGTSQADSIIIPEKTAKKLKAEVGDEVMARMTTVTNQNNVVSFRIVGIAKDTSDYADAFAYATLAYTADALNLKKGEFQSMNILLPDVASTDSDADALFKALSKNLTMAARQTSVAANNGSTAAPGTSATGTPPLGGGMGGTGHGMGGGMGMGNPAMMAPSSGSAEIGTKLYSLTTINDMMRSVQTLITMLDTVGKIVFAVLLLITMVGIGNTFRMMLLERVKEIGTMRALGMQRKEVLKVFLYESAFLAVTGCLAGVILSFVLGFAIQLLPVNGISSLFLHHGRLSYIVDLAVVLAAAASLILLSVTAAFSPSRQASRLDPAAALRSTH